MDPETLQTKLFNQETVSAAVGVLVEGFKARNQTLTVVQVGGCNGQIENDYLHAAIKGQNHVQAHLVEAVKWLYDELLKVMEPYSAHIKCHHAAIAAQDEVRPFYSVSPEYGVDHPEAEEWKQFQIGSLTNQHIKNWVPEKYIVTDVMDVWSPATFMGRIGLNRDDLNLLMVDSEGFDGEIVNTFLDLTHPEMIVYEHHVMPTEDKERLFERLDGRYAHKVIGYDVLACRIGC
jgi:hypothetical protein